MMPMLAGSQPFSIGAVMLVAATHAGSPNHWAPFVLVGRSHGWSRRKVLAVTSAAALGHALITALLGGIVALLGHEMKETAETFGERFAAIVLVTVGIVYVVMGLRGHVHSHEPPPCEDRPPGHSHPFIVLSLVSMLSFSPCMAVAAAFLPAPTFASVIALAAAYATVTVVSMTLIVFVAYYGVERLKLHVFEKHGQLITGVLLALLGIGVALAGCSKTDPMPARPRAPAAAKTLSDDEALLQSAHRAPIDQQIALCERILRDYPESASAFDAAHILAQDYPIKGDSEAARAICERIVEKYRNPVALSNAFAYLAQYWEWKGQHEKAKPYLEQGVALLTDALAKDPSGWTGPSGILLADWLYGLGRDDEAIAAYRKIIDASTPKIRAESLQPLSAAQHMADAYRRSGKPAEAKAALDEAEKLLVASPLDAAAREKIRDDLKKKREEIGG
jgi:nickel/cobalt transporter (NicO) family protein